MYYSQSGFEIVFYSPCNITDLVYRGWVGGGWGGVVGGKPKTGKSCHYTDYGALYGAVPSVKKAAIRVHGVVLSLQ